jgi:uncharacterized protein YegL
MSNSATNLIQNAFNEGDLSAGSLSALNKITDLGNIIQQGLGIDPSLMPASEVVLVSVLGDDSGSIRFSGNEQAVRDGYNGMLDSLLGSKQQDNILVLTKFLNGKIHCSYIPLSDVEKLDKSNYQATGGTPLYDETVKILATVIAKTKEFENNGIEVRTITLLATDGADEGSRTSDASDVKKIVEEMLTKEKHIVAAMGFDNGHCNFQQVFTEMGIPDQWQLTAGSTANEIRKAFQVFSRSATSASKSAANFATASAGGFGNP